MDIPLEYSQAALPILHNNHRPEPWEEALAHAEIERGKKICHAIDEETEQLRKQINELQDQVKRLLEKRTLVVKFIDDHKAILSPLRRHWLPPEVWAQIFHYTAPVVRFDPSHKIDDQTDIWSLGRVCSEWRTALLSFGSLWSVLQIVIDHFKSYRCAAVPLLKEALSRSKEGPLDISLYLHDCPNNLPDILHTLTAVSHRWRAIEIPIMPEEQLSLLSVVEGRVPMLESLTFSCNGGLSGFAEAPSLREVSVYVSNATVSPATLQLPWSQLRRCHIECYDGALESVLTPQQELNLLRICPNLEIHSLRTFKGNSASNFSSSDVVYLHKLHTLSLELGIGITLVDNLILPSLNSVILRSLVHVQQDMETVGRLKSLISRSSAYITTMEMSRIDNPRLFIEVLKLDDLTTLRLEIVVRDDILLQILTIKPEESRVTLPRLEILHFHPFYYQGDPELNLEPMIQMVQSRWHIPDVHRKTTSRLAFLEFKPYGVSFKMSYTALARILALLLVFRHEGLRLGPKLESDCKYVYKLHTKEKEGEGKKLH